jgi:hypothetical protein
VPRLCGLHPGICLTTEEKARKNLSQGNRRVPTGTMKIHKHTIKIHSHNNKNTYITLLNRNKTIYTLIKNRTKNMKECDNSKIHTSSNFILSISLLII